MPRPKVRAGRSIVAKAPCRVDLAGGTVDLWPLYLFHPGAVVVNFAVNVITTCRVTELPGKSIELRSLDTGRKESFRDLGQLMAATTYQHPLAAYLLRFFQPDGGLRVETNSESPAGAGISGSSALMIATTAALARYTGKRLPIEEIRVIAQNVEAQLIQVPTGCQDYYPAMYGGANAIHLGADGIHRERINVPLEEIDSRFVLAYTGAPRQSGINNWEVFKKHIDGERKVFRNFEEIVAIAKEMHQALAGARWSRVAELLRREWTLRRTNAPGITTPFIDHLISVARRNGALAAKVCGAGGGGCVIFQVEKGTRGRVEESLRDARSTVLPMKVARRGLIVKEAPVHPTE